MFKKNEFVEEEEFRYFSNGKKGLENKEEKFGEEEEFKEEKTKKKKQMKVVIKYFLYAVFVISFTVLFFIAYTAKHTITIDDTISYSYYQYESHSTGYYFDNKDNILYLDKNFYKDNYNINKFIINGITYYLDMYGNKYINTSNGRITSYTKVEKTSDNQPFKIKLSNFTKSTKIKSFKNFLN